MDLRPHQALRRDQRGLPQLNARRSRLDRRPGEAARFPAALLDALAERIRALEPRGAAVLVAIDGWGCGGKTALAEGLLDRLEPGFRYLGLDEFFAGFGSDEGDGPVPHLRWNEVTATIGALAAAGRPSLRAFDWERGGLLDPEPLDGAAWLVEGLFSQRAELKPFYDLAIWVEGRLLRRLDRVAARDGAHMVPFWERDWIPRERAYIATERPWSTADIVIAGADLPLGELGRQLRRHGR